MSDLTGVYFSVTISEFLKANFKKSLSLKKSKAKKKYLSEIFRL